MKKTTKKIISLALSLILTVTMLPMFTITSEAAVRWTPIASSDFSSVQSVSQDTQFTPSTYNNQGSAMSWTPHAWTGNGNPSVDSENGAIAIPDGYMYLSGYSGGCVPIDGETRWKIDFGFRFNTNDSGNDRYYNSDNYSFLKMYVYESDLSAPVRKNAAYCLFSQNANGVCYSWEDDGHNVGTQSQATSITTDNGNLTKDTNYHYVAEYLGYRFRAYITDDEGTIVQLITDTTESTFINRLGNSASVRVNSIKIGDDDDSYYFKGLEYQNITFYSGDFARDETTSAIPSNSDDKFVMAYFTGNYSLDNESLRYAVSEDGINFHALNKGMPVTKINIPESGEGLTVYPTGTATGAWSTGHVRDPFILRKRDGSGFFILATDLDTATHGFDLNSKFLVWEVTNLQDVTNTQPWAIDIRDMMGSYTRRAWAPEAIYDSVTGKYMLYFSAQCDGKSGTHLYYVYTSDFKSFTGTPTRLINPGTNNIDASIIHFGADGGSQDSYYMWYKNESNATIAYARSSSINGPYIESTPFNAGSVEGPEIYQDKNGRYILLADEYGASADPATSKQGVFKAYASIQSPTSGFSEVSTNIPYLYARHAGVTRITNSEYNALINAYGGMVSNDKVEFFFTGGTSRTGNGWLGSVKDPGEHTFKVSNADSGDSSYTTGTETVNGEKDGVLTLNNANVFMQDDDLRTILKSNAFTVNFKCKITDSDLIDESTPIVSIGNINKDYIRLETDGDFYVNGQTKVGAFIPNANTEYDISITYNGATASVFVDGDYKAGLVLDDSVVDPSGAQCYLALGWSDTCSADKISAKYRDLTITGEAIETGNKDEEVIDEYIENEDVDSAISDMSKVTQSSGNIYFGSSAVESGYYSNILYASRQTEFYNDTKVGYKDGITTKRVQMRVSYPTVTAFYDGSNTIKIPCILGIKQESGGSNVYPNMTYTSTSGFSVKGKWKGYNDNFVWPSNDTEIIGYTDTQNNTSTFYTNGQNFGNNTERSLKNYFIYYGTPSSTLTTQNGTTWEFGVNTNGERDRDSSSSKYTSYGGQDMVIRIIDVRGINTIIDGLKSGTVTEYNTIKSNPNYYTPQSIKAYLQAIEDVSDFNLNSYFSMSTTSADGTNNYSSAVSDLDAVVNAYNTAKNGLTRQYKITYEDYHGDEIDHYYFANGTASAKLASVAPSLTACADYDNNYHYTYTWANAGFANVASAAMYTPSIDTQTAHSWSGYVYDSNNEHTGTCTVNGQEHTKNFACNHSTAQTHVAPSGDTNGYTDYACSLCSHIDTANRVWDNTETYWTEYKAKAATISVNYADGNYTTSSRNSYKTACDAITNNVTVYDASKSQSFIAAQTAALTTAERYLNHVADYSTLDSFIESSDYTTPRNSPNTYTYSTWVPYAEAFNDANDVYSDSTAVRANKPMYAVDGSGYVTSSLSTEQNDINDAAAALSSAKTALKSNADSSYYQNFDAAYAIAKSVNRDKFNDDGIAYLDGANCLGRVNSVYKVLNASEAADYSALTGVSFSAGAKIKNVATENYSVIEDNTSGILTALNTLDSNKVSYYKSMRATFTIIKDGTTILDAEPYTVYYGENFTFNAGSSYTEGDSIVFSATKYKNCDSGTMSGSAGSFKVPTDTASISQLANCHMAVVAEIKTDSQTSGKKSVRITDIYNKLLGVEYVSDISDVTVSGNRITVNGNTYEAPTIPFYTFSRWKAVWTEGFDYTYRAMYTANNNYSFTVTHAELQGGISGEGGSISAEYDTKLTLTSPAVGESQTMYGWVAKKNNKYQIISYNTAAAVNYQFFACADETLMPFVKQGENYYVKDATDTLLTIDNVDSFTYLDEANLGNANAADIRAAVLKSKLDNKRAFVTITNKSQELVSGSKYRFSIAMRKTNGAAAPNSVALVFRANASEDNFYMGVSGVKSVAVTNIKSNGQFTVSANATYSTAKIRGYVNYDTSYNSQNVNFSDYSQIETLSNS